MIPREIDPSTLAARHAIVDGEIYVIKGYRFRVGSGGQFSLEKWPTRPEQDWLYASQDRFYSAATLVPVYDGNVYSELGFREAGAEPDLADYPTPERYADAWRLWFVAMRDAKMTFDEVDAQWRGMAECLGITT